MQAPTASPLLEGRWRLLFTTRPGTASPIQRTFTGVDSFTVYQEILFSSPDGPRVNNIVDFGPKVGFLKARQRRAPASAIQSVSQRCLLAAGCGSRRHSNDLRLQQHLLLMLAACCCEGLLAYQAALLHLMFWGLHCTMLCLTYTCLALLQVEAEASTDSRPLPGFTPRKGAGLPFLGKSVTYPPARRVRQHVPPAQSACRPCACALACSVCSLVATLCWHLYDCHDSEHDRRIKSAQASPSTLACGLLQDLRVDFQFDRAAFTFPALPFKVPYPVPFKLFGDETKARA